MLSHLHRCTYLMHVGMWKTARATKVLWARVDSAGVSTPPQLLVSAVAMDSPWGPEILWAFGPMNSPGAMSWLALDLGSAVRAGLPIEIESMSRAGNHGMVMTQL